MLGVKPSIYYHKKSRLIKISFLLRHAIKNRANKPFARFFLLRKKRRVKIFGIFLARTDQPAMAAHSFEAGGPRIMPAASFLPLQIKCASCFSCVP